MNRGTFAAELRSVSFAHVREAPVLVNVDLAVEWGERLALIGPNGGGKTTLLRILLGLLEPDSGRVEVLGRRPVPGRQSLGYVPQHSTVDVSVPASVLDVVSMGCLRRSPWGVRFGRAQRALARAALDGVGLSELAERRLGELSGGQVQRVLIARALITEPDLLLLDEPTTAVDADNEVAILTSLTGLGNTTMVLVTHDLDLASRHCHRVVHVDRQVRAHALPSSSSIGRARTCLTSSRLPSGA